MKPKAGIILQARMGSKRLPGKALEHVGGRSILEQCVRRLLSSGVAPVVLATTDRAEDDVLAVVARGLGATVFRGEELDVLDRYLRCAMHFGFDLVVRATADNPGVDMLAPSRVLQAMFETSADYVQENSLPHGAAVEGVTQDALVRASLLVREKYDREHVTTFVKRRPDLFRIVERQVPSALARPDIRLTVDTPDDLHYVRELYFDAGVSMPALGDLIAAADRVSRESVA